MRWSTTRFEIDLHRPRVMGIVNVTPDSFSDGGRHHLVDAAVAYAHRLIDEGVDILDIGGESTRPGSQPPGDAEELRRVLPVLEALRPCGVPLSVDTSSAAVIKAALQLDVDIINDVRSLQRPGALDAVAAHGRCGVCLMHMRGEPDTMQDLAHYGDVVSEVKAELGRRLHAVEAAGVDSVRVAIDPGIGFAKTASHNLALLRRQAELLELGRPLLAGWSRKGTLGLLTGKAVRDRQAASVAAALLAVERGARIVRVHDVAATVDALRVWRGVQCGQAPLPD